jgi:hypothetical protein
MWKSAWRYKEGGKSALTFCLLVSIGASVTYKAERYLEFPLWLGMAIALVWAEDMCIAISRKEREHGNAFGRSPGHD